MSTATSTASWVRTRAGTRAYVHDELTIDQLGERVAVAHVAETLDQLDAALTDLSVA